MALKYRPLVSIPEFGPDAVCADHTRQPLLDWRAAVAARGGTLEANSLTRTCAQQQKLRDAYVNWLNAGKPNPPVAAANKPGRSGHQGGISIDAKTRNAFPKEPANQQIDLLWETGRAFGWTPIIAIPDENASERWHFDHFGDWSTVKSHLGYETACLCTALDVGQAGEWQSDERLVQALLLKAGFDIGEPDGILGKRSWAAIRKITTETSLEVVIPLVRAVPSAAIWVKL
jgi:hypothetical protein